MKIRALGPGDVAEVARLDADLFGADAWSGATYRAEFARTDRLWLGVQDDGQLVAYGGVLLGAQSDVLSIGVRRERRREGIGRLLLAELVAAARAHGGRELFLEVRTDNDAARLLYESFGFAQIARRRRYYRDGTDARVMVLPLVAPGPGPVGSETRVR